MASIAAGSIGRELAAMLAVEKHGGLGRPLVSFASVTSTNDVARELALQGAAEGTLVVADQQQRGRGRLGREWFSPAGAGLWCSLVLRPPLPLAGLAPLALVAAAGARAAIERAAELPCRVKWPNDLLVHGRKTGGILAEAAGGSLAQPPDFVILGIGINVDLGSGDLPEALRDRTTSVSAAAGRPVAVAPLGVVLLTELDRVYSQFLRAGFAALRREWIAGSETVGRQITVTGPRGTLTGWAETIDEHGRLVLRLPDGSAEHIAAGDVSLAYAAAGSGPFAAGA